MSNVHTVQEIYAAFGRGDVPAILSRLSESVEWEYGPTSFEEDEIHVWRFDADGRVVRHRHWVDTHLHQLAWAGK